MTDDFGSSMNFRKLRLCSAILGSAPNGNGLVQQVGVGTDEGQKIEILVEFPECGLF